MTQASASRTAQKVASVAREPGVCNGESPCRRQSGVAPTVPAESVDSRLPHGVPIQITGNAVGVAAQFWWVLRVVDSLEFDAPYFLVGDEAPQTSPTHQKVAITCSRRCHPGWDQPELRGQGRRRCSTAEPAPARYAVQGSTRPFRPDHGGVRVHAVGPERLYPGAPNKWPRKTV